MTPATGTLHFLATKQEEFNIKVIHPEDEISAANMTAGAAFAGARSATGSSGGGFALMNEAISYCGVAEIGMVYYLVSRPGPATGLPTWTAQADLLHAIYSGHGEFPKVVIAPGDLDESFEMGIESLNLAAELQTPIIVVSDKFLGESSSNTKDLSKIKIIRSHAQPIAQSGNWIKDNFPNVIIEATSSSAKAMLETRDPQVAFIGSIEASKQYNLTVLAENIEDKKNNVTEFYVISKSKNTSLSKKLKASRTALILVVHDKPGVLKDILEAFSKRKLNLTKLHSKVSDLEDYNYYFYLEVEGLVGDNAEMDEALKEVDTHCYIKQVLGVV